MKGICYSFSLLSLCYSFTLLISYIGFNPFKMAVQFFLTASNFPILMARMIVSQIQQAPGPDSREVRKSLSPQVFEFTRFDLSFEMMYVSGNHRRVCGMYQQYQD